MVYEYKENYLDFCNIQELPSVKFLQIQNDFCNVLDSFMRNALGVQDSCLVPITLFTTMVNKNVFYHTPFHIMSIFEFAKTHNLSLQVHEKLAIWFHDAIYRPGYSQNEEKSKQFMNSLLSGIGVDSRVLLDASVIIDDTANHLKTHVTPGSELVLDLDLSGFSAGVKSFRIQNECIEKEFVNPNSATNMNGFLVGRIMFLERLLMSDKIYSTKYFQNNFENIARQNIKNLIVETKTRLVNYQKTVQ